MEPSQKNKKKWIIFGVIIAVIAALILVVPYVSVKYMKEKYLKPNVVTSDLMIQIKGVIKQAEDEENTLYLEGSENGLYYVLFGDKLEELTANIGQTATVFGNMYEPINGKTIKDKPIRMRIMVVNYGIPDLK